MKDERQKLSSTQLPQQEAAKEPHTMSLCFELSINSASLCNMLASWLSQMAERSPRKCVGPKFDTRKRTNVSSTTNLSKKPIRVSFVALRYIRVDNSKIQDQRALETRFSYWCTADFTQLYNPNSLNAAARKNFRGSVVA